MRIPFFGRKDKKRERRSDKEKFYYRIDWKHVALVCMSMAMAVYMVFALTAFNVPADERNHQVCTQLTVNIDEVELPGFLTADEVIRLLNDSSLSPVTQPMVDVNVRHIEEALERHPLIVSANCHKGQRGHVYIRLSQKEPMLRIQANDGSDYYMDFNCETFQSTSYSKNLLLATGHISAHYADSVLFPMAKLICKDEFWNNQVMQINVLSDETIEIVPRVGDNILYLGDGSGVERKLERLEEFYRYGLSHAGWNKYERISVELDNQIICKRRSKKQ